MNAQSLRPGAKRNGFVLVGAALTIVAGVLSLTNGVRALAEEGQLFSFIPSSVQSLVPACGALLVLFGLVGLVAGVYALRPRPRLSFPLVGAVLGMLGGGLFGFFLGLAAILLFWMSDEDL